MEVSTPTFFELSHKCIFRTPIERIVLHDIPISGKICGIYMLCFDDYFYIGQSINILSRIRTHIRDINIHYNDRHYDTKTSKKILYFLDKNMVNEVNVYLLEECDMFKLPQREYYWLKKYVLDKKSLNYVCEMRHSPSYYKKQILIGSHELKFDLKTKAQIKLYQKFVADLKKLKKNNL
jgi:hypothetical protein